MICILEADENLIKRESKGGVTVCKTSKYLIIGRYDESVIQIDGANQTTDSCFTQVYNVARLIKENEEIDTEL